MHGDFSFKQLITLVFLPQALSLSMPKEERGKRGRRKSATNEPNYLSTLRIGHGIVCVSGACVGGNYLSKPNEDEDDLENSLNLVVDKEQGKNVLDS